MSEQKNGSAVLAENIEKMKAMVNDLRTQLFEATQKNELLENEVQSSIRLMWAAAKAQPDGMLRIPKGNLEMIGPDCQLESGFDHETQETWFKAIRLQ